MIMMINNLLIVSGESPTTETKMYLLTIASGSIKEINRVMKELELDLWKGVKVKSKAYADSIIAQALLLEPFLEINMTCID
jgi:hypothetical protein